MSFATALAPSTVVEAPAKPSEWNWDRQDNTKESKNKNKNDSARLMHGAWVLCNSITKLLDIEVMLMAYVFTY